MITAKSTITPYHEPADIGPDLAPMLDVIFLLMVFFILTAQQAQPIVGIELPEQNAERATISQQTDVITIVLYPAADQWGLGNKHFDNWSSLEQAINDTHRQQPHARFVIAGDRNAPMERLLLILAYLDSLGVGSADIRMQTPPNQQNQPPTQG